LEYITCALPIDYRRITAILQSFSTVKQWRFLRACGALLWECERFLCERVRTKTFHTLTQKARLRARSG